MWYLITDKFPTVVKQEDYALSIMARDFKGMNNHGAIVESVCVGGIGEKKSNKGTQYYQQDRVYTMGDISMCQPSSLPGGSYSYIEVKDKIMELTEDLKKWIWEKDGKKYLIRIRKLTPKECWRLMGFTDEDFQKAAEVNSN